MYNVFTHRKETEKAEIEAKKVRRSARLAVVKEQKKDEMRRVSVGRAVEWVGKHMSEDYANTVKSGGVPLFHPSAHQFRLSPKESSRNIYLRHYLPGKDRAEASEADYNSSHLSCRQNYNINSPHTHTDWIRRPDPRKFLCGAHTVYHPQSDSTRLKTSASASRIVTLEGIDRFKIACPVFRPRTKEKDMDMVEFNRFVKPYDQRSTAWMTPEVYDGEKYVDGYAVIGDISKRRNKEKEVNDKDFALTSPKDPWSVWTTPNPSVRDLNSAEQLRKLELVPSSRSAKSTAGTASLQLSPKFYKKTYESQVTLVPLISRKPSQQGTSREEPS